MSIGKTDIGNLDDVEDDEESDMNLSAKVAEITSQMSQLHTANQNMGNPFGDPDLDVDEDIGICCFISAFLFISRKRSPKTIKVSKQISLLDFNLKVVYEAK
jgi:hypothetical protein